MPSSLGMRRLIVWGVSMLLGFVIAWLIITVVFPIIKPEAAGTTIAKYGIQYFLATAIPIGLIFVIWLDHFMETRILPD